MKPFTLTLSHPYKEMRERTSGQAEGKTTLLGVGWTFPHCRWTGSPSSMMAAAVTVAITMTAAMAITTARIITVATPRSARRGIHHRRVIH